MNNRNYFLLSGLIAILAIALIVLVFRSQSRLHQTENDLQSALLENTRLYEQNVCLERLLNDCETGHQISFSPSVIQTEEVKTETSSTNPIIKIITESQAKITKPKTTSVKKVVSKKPVVKPNTTAVRAAEETRPSIVYGSGPSSGENFFPAYFYEPGTEGVKFCIRLGGDESRHLPHLAITSGNIKAETNGISGYNWVVDGPVSDLVGDWGITEDKTFFVSVAMVENFLSPEDNDLVELKAPATNWKAMPMTRFGDYFIFRIK